MNTAVLKIKKYKTFYVLLQPKLFPFWFVNNRSTDSFFKSYAKIENWFRDFLGFPSIHYYAEVEELGKSLALDLGKMRFHFVPERIVKQLKVQN